MPWKIEKRGNKYAVINADTGDVKGEHPSRKAAQAQMRALYANVPDSKESMAIFKQADGSLRWVVMSSSSFKDRDGEIVSTKALEDDVARADADGDYGTLRWWHVPGMDLGPCDFNMMSGKILIESGTFYDDAIGAKLKEVADGLEVSLGFYHPATEPDQDRVFHTIRRFERSLLPRGVASNLTTGFFVGDEMATKEEKKKKFRELVGDDNLADRVFQTAEKAEQDAVASGTSFKAVQEEPEEEEKGKKKPPFPPKKEEEKPEEEAEESAGDAEEAEAEEEPEKEEEEEPKKEEGKFPPKKKEFSDFSEDEVVDIMVDAISEALEPYIDEVHQLGEELKEISSVVARREKESEGREEKIEELERKLKEAEANLDKATQRIKELEGSVPRGAKGYVASQSPDTVTTDPERLKQAPTSDPKAAGMATFTNFVLNSPNGQSGD